MAAANANRTSTLPKLELIAQGAITAICKFSRLLEIICKRTESNADGTKAAGMGGIKMRSQKKRAGEKMENLLLRRALVPSAALYLITQFMYVHMTPKHFCSEVENSSPARSDPVYYQTFTKVHSLCAFQPGGSKKHRIRSSANTPIFLSDNVVCVPR